MNITELQALRTGETIRYAGKLVQVVDWKALLEPVYHGSDKVYAWPIVKHECGKIMITDPTLCEKTSSKRKN